MKLSKEGQGERRIKRTEKMSREVEGKGREGKGMRGDERKGSPRTSLEEEERIERQ